MILAPSASQTSLPAPHSFAYSCNHSSPLPILNTSGSHTLGWEICSGLFPQMSAWPTLFSSQPLVMLLSDETCPDYPVLNVSLPPCYTCTLSFPVICTRFFHSIYFLTHYVIYLFTVSSVCLTHPTRIYIPQSFFFPNLFTDISPKLYSNFHRVDRQWNIYWVNEIYFISFLF